MESGRLKTWGRRCSPPCDLMFLTPEHGRRRHSARAARRRGARPLDRWCSHGCAARVRATCRGEQHGPRQSCQGAPGPAPASGEPGGESPPREAVPGGPLPPWPPEHPEPPNPLEARCSKTPFSGTPHIPALTVGAPPPQSPPAMLSLLPGSMVRWLFCRIKPPIKLSRN